MAKRIIKFRKGEIRRYNNVIDYIREEIKSDRDFWSSLFSAGLTFNDDIERFCHYASQVGALDISEEILKCDNFKHLI
jgi:hypothetical protein